MRLLLSSLLFSLFCQLTLAQGEVIGKVDEDSGDRFASEVSVLIMRLFSFCLLSLFCQVTLAQGEVIGKVDEDNGVIDATVEVETVDVVGHQKGQNFEQIDAKDITKMVDAQGGVEAIVKTQLGVASNNELSSQYRVRGGNFDENMIYVNGIEIYRPFLIRSGEQEGLSFVNPDMVEGLDFSSGGFDVSYGDRMSSVLDVTYKTPQKTSGSAKVSLMGGSASFEGRAGNHLTHTSGVRYKTNKYLVGTMDTKGQYDPSFFDAQTYWSLRFGDSSIDLLGYYGSNNYRFVPEDRETSFGTVSDARKLKIYFEGNEKDRYNTGVLALRYHLDKGKNRYNIFASLYKSGEEENYDILGEYWLQQADYSSSTEDVDQSENIGVGGNGQHARNLLYCGVYTVAVNAEHRLGVHRLSWEVRYAREHFNNYVNEWEYNDSTGFKTFFNIAKAHNRLNSDRVQMYVKDAYTTSVGEWRMALSYGVRMAYYSTNDEWIVSPRASVRFNHNGWALRVSGGRYAQTPFYKEMQTKDGTLTTDVKAQNSWQVLLGTDKYFMLSERNFKFTCEAYYKWLRRVNPYSIDNVRIQYEANNDARGYGVGLDAKVNGELADGVESWACFSIMQTMENIAGDGHGWIPRPADQRVSFSMFLQDQMPGNYSYGATLSMFFASGLPFGPPNKERYLATNRMPGYKRVDFGLYKDFAIRADGSQRWNIKSLLLAVEVFNLFNFSNTISYFWVAGVDGTQYAVPNYLTARRLNVKISFEF